MIKTSIIIFLFFSSLDSICQEIIKDIYFKKTIGDSIYCQIFSDNQVVYKECYSLYDSTMLYSELYIDSLLTGIKNTYHSNGLLHTQSAFLKGKIVGSYLEFSNNGSLLVKGSFNIPNINTRVQELFCSYDEYGIIDNPGLSLEKKCYSSPKNGKWIYFFDDGGKFSEGYYKNNIKIGKWKYYDFKGNVVNTEEF